MHIATMVKVLSPVPQKLGQIQSCFGNVLKNRQFDSFPIRPFKTWTF